MIFDISHRTLYRYSQQVVHSQHIAHMTPRSSTLQTVRHHSLIVEPAPALRTETLDVFGNAMVTLDIEVPHRELVLHARSTIETRQPALHDPASSMAWDRLDDSLETGSFTSGSRDGSSRQLDIIQYRCASRFTQVTPDIADYGDAPFVPGRPVMAAAMELTSRIFRDFTFDASATDISTPLAHVLRRRRGVCQDFAHLALAVLRSRRVPARYVSGYILTRPPPGQARLNGADASHAWISVWSPETGWVDFDPTNGIMVADEHTTIATGRDYTDVAPISGVLLGGGEHTVAVAVDVVPQT